MVVAHYAWRDASLKSWWLLLYLVGDGRGTSQGITLVHPEQQTYANLRSYSLEHKLCKCGWWLRVQTTFKRSCCTKVVKPYYETTPSKQSTTRQVESQIHWRRQGERHIQQSILQGNHGSTHTRLTPKLSLLNPAFHLFTEFSTISSTTIIEQHRGCLQSGFPPDRRSRPHKNPSKSTCFPTCFLKNPG